MVWLFQSPNSRRFANVVAGIGLVAVIATVLAIPFRHWQTERAFQAAAESFRKSRLAEARSLLDGYLQRQPNSFAGNLLMARISRRAKYYNEAEVYLDICEVLPGPAESVELERCLIRAQQGDLAWEKLLWSQARQRPDQAVDIFEALAHGYRKNYLLKKMRSCLDAWIDQEPNFHALLERGWVREREMDYHGAVSDYQRARTVDKDRDAESRVRAAQAMLFLKQAAEALQELEPLAQQRRSDPKVGLAFSQAWIRLGQPEKGRQLLDELLEAHPHEFAILLERGRLALEQEGADKAEHWLRLALKQMPHDYQAVFSLTQALKRQNKVAELASLQVKLKNLEADMNLMADLTTRLQTRPSDPSLRCEIGTLFFRSGEDREALLWLKSALRSDPNHAATHEALARYYERIGQSAVAARHRQQANSGSSAPASAPPP